MSDAARIAEILNDRTSRRYGRYTITYLPKHIADGCIRGGLPKDHPVFWDSCLGTWIILTEDKTAILVELSPRLSSDSITRLVKASSEGVQ